MAIFVAYCRARTWQFHWRNFDGQLRNAEHIPDLWHGCRNLRGRLFGLASALFSENRKAQIAKEIGYATIVVPHLSRLMSISVFGVYNNSSGVEDDMEGTYVNQIKY